MHKKTYLRNVIFIMTLLFSISLSAQTGSEVIKNWTALEEAEFHYDVSYTVVKCTPSATAMVLLNAFNEDGTNPKVGFTLAISDAAGNTAEVVITPFASSLGDMRIASCSSDEYSNLKFEVPAGIDASTIKMDITYQTGS
jgi:hypothetical protein